MYYGKIFCWGFSAAIALMLNVQPVSSETVDKIISKLEGKGYHSDEKPYSEEPTYISRKPWRKVYRAFEGSWDGKSVKDHNHRIGYIYDPTTENLKVLFFLYNAHSIDGDTVCLFASFNDSKRNSVLSQFMRLGIDAQLTGHAKRRIEYQDYHVPRDIMDTVQSVSFAVKECPKYKDGKIVAVIVDKIKPLVVGACTAYTGQAAACAIGTEAIVKEATK
jgi:hypothetical protein